MFDEGKKVGGAKTRLAAITGRVNQVPAGKRAQAFLGALPRRACLMELGRPGVGQADQLLAPILPGPDGDPAGVDQGAKVAGERRLIQDRTAPAPVRHRPPGRARQRVAPRAGPPPAGRGRREVGFSDQSHFTHHFRRLVGVTPRRIR